MEIFVTFCSVYKIVSAIGVVCGTGCVTVEVPVVEGVCARSSDSDIVVSEVIVYEIGSFVSASDACDELVRMVVADCTSVEDGVSYTAANNVGTIGSEDGVVYDLEYVSSEERWWAYVINSDGVPSGRKYVSCVT